METELILPENRPEGSNPSLTVLLKRSESDKSPTSQRFWSHVDKSSEDGCWPWLLSLDKDGYGRFTVGRKKFQSHRYAYFLTHGATNAFILHRCDNPRCVNPSHLFLGSHADNMRDRNAKRRHAFGTRNGRSKLQPADIIEIRLWRKLNASFRSIASRFGVDESVIRDIASGKTWAHVTSPQPASNQPEGVA